MIRRSAMFVAWLLAANATANSCATSSQNGMRISTHEVHLAENVPVGCVAVTAEHDVATIVLSREELDRLAAFNEGVDESETARLASLAGSRAQALIKQLGPNRDVHGCLVVKGDVPFETSFLVGQLLEKGHATVFPKNVNRPVPMLQIRHVSTPVGSWEEFRLLDGPEIWGYGATVS